MASSRPPLSPAEIGKRIEAQFGDDVVGRGGVRAPRGHRHPRSVRRDRPVPPRRRGPGLRLLRLPHRRGLAAQGGRRFEVVTHLYSTGLNHHVRFKVACDADDPHCPTISEVWPGANWCERETCGAVRHHVRRHPHLVKLLLPEQFEGYPLRKDFELMSREVKPWPGESEGAEESTLVGLVVTLASDAGQLLHRPVPQHLVRPPHQDDRHHGRRPGRAAGHGLHGAQGARPHAVSGSARCTRASSTAGPS